MSILNVNILINDTSVAATILNVERTENANPQLKYNGADDEYQPIMASKLTFNMLVENAEDAHFLHLLTGNETRFEVQLEDANTNELLWQGFLLPDQYSEPYENGALFVQFTATDGLGRLKNKYLPDAYYSEVKRIPDVITACLKLTGNSFTTIIAPAITSAVVTIDENDKEIDTSVFVENNKKHNAYQILEDLIAAMACKLFQQQGVWYVVGINNFNKLEVPCEFYASNGTKYIADGITYFTRPVKAVVFEASPSVTAIPPFKRVSVNWDKDQRDNVFPEDIVLQAPETVLVDGVYVPKYWEAIESVTDAYWLTLSYKGNSVINIAYNNNGFVPVVKGFNVMLANYLNVVTAANIDSNYINLSDPVYVLGSFLEPQFVNVTIEINVDMQADPTEAELEALKQKILYEITLDGVTLVSNKAIFDVDGLYDFEFNKVDGSKIKATLNLENIAITKDGYVDVKLHPPIYTDAVTNDATVFHFTELDVSLVDNDLKKEFILNRTIDYTTQQDVEIPYGFSENNLISNRLLLSPFVANPGVDIDYPREERNIPFLNYNKQFFSAVTESYNFSWWKISIAVSDEYFNYLQQYREHIYIKKAGSGAILPMYIVEFYETEDEKGIVQIQFEETENMFEATDELMVIVEAYTETITEDNYLQQAWRRVGSAENVTYENAIARIYHSACQTTKFKVEGTIFGLIFPLDLLQFRYLMPKNYNVTSLTLNLSQGVSNVVMVESINKEISDYE